MFKKTRDSNAIRMIGENNQKQIKVKQSRQTNQCKARQSKIKQGKAIK